MVVLFYYRKEDCMGNKDNPRRRVNGKQIAGGVGALLVSGFILYGSITVGSKMETQSELIKNYKESQVEQGSLIDQQEKELSNQKSVIKDLKKQVEGLNEQLGKEKENGKKATQDFNQREDVYQEKIKDLQQELTSKRAAQKAEEAKAVVKAEQAKTVVKAEQKAEPKIAKPVVTKVAAVASKPVEEKQPEVKSTGRKVQVEATAYIAMCSEGCTGVTATGINLKDNPNKKVIAVDPSVIPLGSKVNVPGYGTAIAGDTGGGINGHEIDIHVPTESQAAQWGRRTVTVEIIS